MLVFRYFQFLLFLLLALLLYVISLKFINTTWHDLVHFLIFPIVFGLVNYAFIKLILSYIKYYNNLLIVYKGQLIVIQSSLFFKDNIEFIDINKITKLDTYCRGLIPNVLWYGNLVVEQQRDEPRLFHFVPELNKALHILKKEKQRTIEERKERYMVQDEKDKNKNSVIKKNTFENTLKKIKKTIKTIKNK